MLHNEVFTDAFLHNMTIVVLSILVQLPLGLAIALLLNRRMRGQGLLRTIIFVPYVLSEVIAGVVWFQLLQPQYGVVDTLLGAVGSAGPEQGWLGTPELRPAHGLRRADLEVPRPGRAALPRRSAGRARRAGRGGRRSTARAGGRSSAGSPCPLLGPTIRIWAFLSMIGSLQLFDMVWILTGGGPANSTTTMATFLVTEGTKRQNYGIAAAASVDPLRRSRWSWRCSTRSSSCAGTSQADATGGSDERRRCPASDDGVGGPATAPRPAYAAARRWSRPSPWSSSRVTLGPVLYAVLGGFRTNAQLAESPAGLPRPLGAGQLPQGADQRDVLALRAELDGHRRGDHGGRRRLRPDGGLSAGAVPVPVA